jgi:hypothetical protein
MIFATVAASAAASGLAEISAMRLKGSSRGKERETAAARRTERGEGLMRVGGLFSCNAQRTARRFLSIWTSKLIDLFKWRVGKNFDFECSSFEMGKLRVFNGRL